MGIDPLIDLFRGGRVGADLFPYLLNTKLFGVVLGLKGVWEEDIREEWGGGSGGNGVMFQYPTRGERESEEEKRRERERLWWGGEKKWSPPREIFAWEKEELGEWGRCAPLEKFSTTASPDQHPLKWLWEGVDLYVIEMTDRLGIVAKKATQYGVAQGITSISAVTPLTDGLGDYAHRKAAECPSSVTPTVIAISLSHLKALKAACDRPDREDVAVVMEDDVNFEPVRYWPDSLRGMVKTLAEKGWRMINGGVTNSNLYETFGEEGKRQGGWGGERKKSYFRGWGKEDWGAQFVIYNLSHPDVCGRIQNATIQKILDNSQGECEVADIFIYREIGGGERGEHHSELIGWGVGEEMRIEGVYSSKMPLVFFSEEAESAPTGAFNMHPTIQAYYHRRAWNDFRIQTLLDCLESSQIQIVTRWDQGFWEAMGGWRCEGERVGEEGWSRGRERERGRECALLVAYVRSEEEIQKAMVCASRSVVRVTTKSVWDWDCMAQNGGCEGQMILEVSGLDSFVVTSSDVVTNNQQQQKIVTFGIGYSTGELTTKLTENNLFLPTGRDPLEGIRREWVRGDLGGCGAGWGGGWVGGWCDVIVGIEWVDAEGRVRKGTKNENEDLFWLFMGVKGKENEKVGEGIEWKGKGLREFPGVITKISALASPLPHSVTQIWCQYDKKYDNEVVNVWVSYMQERQGGRGVVEVGVVTGGAREGWIELKGVCFGCGEGMGGELETFEEMVAEMRKEIERKIEEKKQQEGILNKRKEFSCERRTTSLLDSFLSPPLLSKSVLKSAKSPLSKREDLLKNSTKCCSS